MSEVDPLVEAAAERECVLAFQYAPSIPPRYFPVFIDVVADDEAATVRVFDPETGAQLFGLLMRADQWEALEDVIKPPDEDDDD